MDWAGCVLLISGEDNSECGGGNFGNGKYLRNQVTDRVKDFLKIFCLKQLGIIEIQS